jgi:hypothetical protein
MTEIRFVVACVECQSHWDDGAAPQCTNPGHVLRRIEVHRHGSRVVFPDGTEVTAVSFDPMDPYARDRPPGYGLYLDRRWQPPWPHDHLEWPDFGAPDDSAGVVDVLSSFRDRARGGEDVELGCYGGHGRTGTALACLAVLCGQPPDAAVAWVRENYCQHAVETPEQEALVGGLRI